MNILIIARGSAHEGIGHLVRARSFARVAAWRHRVTIAAVCTPQLEHLVDAPGVDRQLVAAEAEIPDLIGAARPDVVIFDMLGSSAAVVEAARGHAKVVASLSPVFDRIPEMDLLFTRTAFPDRIEGPTIYSGIEYAVFSDACTPIPNPVFEANVALDVLPMAISLGGGDSANDTLTLLDAVAAVEPPCSIWVLLGDAYEHSLDELSRRVRDIPRHEIVIARANRSMWHILGNCAVGILSRGLSTLEAMHAGLPVISVQRSNDPSWMLKTVYDKYCLFGGSINERSTNRITELIGELYADRDRLRNLRRRQMEVVDADGPKRIVAVLEQAVSDAGTAGRRDRLAGGRKGA